ncbi:hypothetical protein [Miniphocaeibacter halophilus]|uniref:Uncharacterized protein n=1 Tax=Miniphocaeibacter halophilus TaxID=2931922 RepID=A0AC61MTN6_9FIRM|nr:hypothetical protein [Miniphocaeibacter halophilus]QQK08189.1 hypothetical protein JFY71_01240 [Miniphocaeibacter halophilus]
MKYINLELRKYSYKPYIMANIGIFIATFLLTALLVAVQYMEAPSAEETLSSGLILTVIITIETVSYICLTAVMYSKFVLESYNYDNVFLTLAYPVNRGKIFFSKLILVNLSSIIGFLISTILIIVLFTLFNNTFNVMMDKLSVEILLSKTPMIILSIIFIISGGIISLLIGWLKKSTALLIVTSVIIGSIVSNLLGTESINLLFVFALIILICGLISTISMYNKIKSLEVE